MSCQICILPFNRVTHFPRVLPCCARSLCSSCCISFDKHGKKDCPFCRVLLKNDFKSLNRNHDLIELLPEWNHSSCSIHYSPNIMICETCEIEICTKCVEAHNSQDHDVIDTELFLNNIDSKLTDYSDWMNKGKANLQENQNLVEKKRNLLKDSVANSFKARIALLEKYMEEALDEIDAYFNELNEILTKSEANESMTKVLEDCSKFLTLGRDFMTNKEKDNKVIELLKFEKLNLLVSLKKWAQSFEKEKFKSEVERYQYEFSLQITENPFKAVIFDEESTTDSQELYRCVLNNFFNNNIFTDPEKAYLIKQIKVFELQDITKSSMLRPVNELVKHLKITINEDLNELDLSSFIKDFVTFVNIETVELTIPTTENKCDFDGLYESLKKLKSLRSLIVHNGELNYEIIAKVLNFERLSEISIKNNENNQIETLFPHLLKCKNLKKLSLDIDKDSISEYKKFLLKLGSLNEIYIKFKKESLKDVPSYRIDYLFQAVFNVPNLTIIALDLDERFQDPSFIGEICKYLQNANDLRDLRLSVNFSNEESLDIITITLSELKKLTALQFTSGDDFQESDVDLTNILNAIGSLKTLTSLSLYVYNFCDLSGLLIALPEFSNLQNLVLNTLLNKNEIQKLSLSKNHQIENLAIEFNYEVDITDEEVTSLTFELESLILLKSLKLDFADCVSLTDWTLDLIAYSSQKLSRLESLTLNFNGCNKLSDFGIENLARSLKYISQLKRIELCFSNNHNFTDKSIDCLILSLSKLTKLTNICLYFDECPNISDDVIEESKKNVLKFPSLLEINLKF